MSEQTGQDSNADNAGAASLQADTSGAPSAASAVAAPGVGSAAPPATPTAIPATPVAAPAAPEAPAASQEPLTALEAAESDKAGMLAVLAEKTGTKSAADETPAAGKTAADAGEGVASQGAAAVDPGAASDDDAPGEDEPDDNKPLTAEERAAVGSKTARKVSRLLRNVKRMEPDATAYRNITRYMAENKLSGDEAAKGFEVMALLKADDPRALEVLQPYIDRLQRAAGLILPDDLKAKVDQGFLDEDGAREIARSRADSARTVARETEQMQMVQDHRAEVARGNIADALNAWEIQQAVNPDYSTLKAAVFDYAQASFRAKPPADAAEAVSRIAGFYASLRQPKPAAAGVVRPAATRPGPSSASSPARLPEREPQSLAERIQLTLQRRGAA